MNPRGQAVQWDSPEQASNVAAGVGAVTGAALGGVLWYAVKDLHPAVKVAGLVLPLAGGVLGYKSWRSLTAPQQHPALAR
jgi:outer membrane lipoprotein SlyB